MIDSAREIENLLYLYAERIDAGDLDGVAELFRHGRIRPGPDAPDDATFEGRDAVRSMYGAATRLYEDGTPLTRHVTIIIGRYHDTFRRIDGRWWFDTRVMLVDLVGDLSQHLLYALR
jgi:hypothetical protein